jgi:hypothetical protein
MGKRFAAVSLFGLLLCASGWAQPADALPAGRAAEPALPGPFSVGISAAMYIPVAEAAHSFGLGGGENVKFGYQIPGTMLFGFASLGYLFILAPVQLTAPTVFLAAAELGFGMRFPITSFLEVRAYGTGGYWYGAFYDVSTSSADPCAGVGLGLQLALTPTFGLSQEAQYKYYFGLWQGLAAGLGMRIFLASDDQQ